MEDERKELFEYQQAQLEREIENLSWKLEREELYKRGDFENQMDSTNISTQEIRKIIQKRFQELMETQKRVN
ncbi:potential E3 ubiquitin- ligase ariadne-2 [Paramuricea clavata]|uniref:Potential E3 ubiquitin- ligase ariadne-2 n=1 Tax=Paramuricea clavata TaxID=317549 RepID=A0A7D9JCA3_PARCT|nr:potential E3 ubiquitin- ligase ariadne-2 [Paramuricea clavata]